MAAEQCETHWHSSGRTPQKRHKSSGTSDLIHCDGETNFGEPRILPLFYGIADPNRASATSSMAEMVTEARPACTTLGVVLGPKLSSLRILHE